VNRAGTRHLAFAALPRHYSTGRLTVPLRKGAEMTLPERLDLIFAALADPTRRRVLSMLLEDDMAVSDVAAPFEMSLAAISKHLAVLAAAGLIRQERRGRITWCKLDPDGMRTASVWMQGFGQFDPVDLDDFERFLRAELKDGDD
jgi:DNA-binding transcriptional ArsR family regulator